MQAVGIHMQPKSGLSVTVANGDHVASLGLCRAMPILIGKEAFTLDCYAMPFDGFDVVLGVQWLRTLGPITWDFSCMTMAFARAGCKVIWLGLPMEPRSARLLACTGTNLMDDLLEEFSSLFAEPHGSSPVRDCYHRIHLKRSTDAIAIRPYRYLQLQKDDLETQCAEMLQQGTIRHSTSTFSSPMILIKKVDGSWRFCVDYCALNDRTIKDKFSIPVVEELLDELCAASFFLLRLTCALAIIKS